MVSPGSDGYQVLWSGLLSIGFGGIRIRGCSQKPKRRDLCLCLLQLSSWLVASLAVVSTFWAKHDKHAVDHPDDGSDNVHGTRDLTDGATRESILSAMTVTTEAPRGSEDSLLARSLLFRPWSEWFRLHSPFPCDRSCPKLPVSGYRVPLVPYAACYMITMALSHTFPMLIKVQRLILNPFSVYDFYNYLKSEKLQRHDPFGSVMIKLRWDLGRDSKAASCTLHSRQMACNVT